MEDNKEYLGDAVYISHDGYSFVLTTEDGTINPTNAIYLESIVVKHLIAYLKKHEAS